MTYINDGAELTYRQRWAHYLTIIFSIIVAFYGYTLRENALNATQVYTNTQSGITAFYPRNWLIDTSGDYVFRVRDMARTGFKTTIQITVRPVTSNTRARNILDSLTLSRSQILSQYIVLSVEANTIQNEIPTTNIFYTFVTREPSPFLEGIPVVVNGIDILTIKRGQAIIITFQADKEIFDEEYARFEQFLATLDF